MKIGFVEPHLQCVGGIRHVVEVAQWLKQVGHTVALYTPFGRKCNWLPNNVPGCKLESLAQEKNEVIVFNLAEQYPIVLEAPADLKIFWVLAPEAMYRGSGPEKVFRPEFKYIANSKFTVSYTNKHIKTDYEIPIVPAGINPVHFRHDPRIPKDKDVLFYGSVRPWKGTDIIRTAVHGMNAWCMEGKNTPQDQMYTLYNRSKVFVSAGLYEGFNMPILEAMACGAAVVCTDDGGSRDFVIPNENALVVKRDKHSIKQAVLCLLANEKFRKSLVVEGLKTAAQRRFDWENVTDKFEQVLHTLR